MQLNEVSGEIVDAAIAVHQELGPGLLESVYEVVLAHELKNRSLEIDRQVIVPIDYKGIRFEEGYRLDLLVNDAVIVEIKSVEEITKVHQKQLLTYLRMMDKPLGLLLNFNVNLMKEGISRIANGIAE